MVAIQDYHKDVVFNNLASLVSNEEPDPKEVVRRIEKLVKDYIKLEGEATKVIEWFKKYFQTALDLGELIPYELFDIEQELSSNLQELNITNYDSKDIYRAFKILKIYKEDYNGEINLQVTPRNEYNIQVLCGAIVIVDNLNERTASVVCEALQKAVDLLLTD